MGASGQREDVEVARVPMVDDEEPVATNRRHVQASVDRLGPDELLRPDVERVELRIGDARCQEEHVVPGDHSDEVVIRCVHGKRGVLAAGGDVGVEYIEAGNSRGAIDLGCECVHGGTQRLADSCGDDGVVMLAVELGAPQLLRLLQQRCPGAR